MKKQFYLAGLLTLWMLWFVPPAFSQLNEAALPSGEGVETTAAEEPEVPASQEVEINEDNYRQFMELKDANRQRDIIPENVFKPGSGLQKLEKLPEESQKHLRNELREIIVNGDPWQPGDENTEYPYTPSAAASTNPALEKQEMEAWGELVGGYHEREAQIYENSSGTQAARGSEQGSSGSPESGTGATGNSGQSEEGSQGQQAGQQGNPEQRSTEGTYSLNGSNDPNANNTTGVSQNAMEYLQGLGKGGNGTEGNDQADSAASGGQGDSPTPSEAQSQASSGQQGGSGQSSAANSGKPQPARDPNAKSTAGASQNAMEFLKGNAGQAETQGDGRANGQADGQSQDGEQSESEQTSAATVPPASTTPVAPAEPDEESTAGASQNALEYLTGERGQAPDSAEDESNTVPPEGTLTIQDLLNAQGVGDSTGTDPASAKPAEEQQPDENKPDKDNEG